MNPTFRIQIASLIVGTVLVLGFTKYLSQPNFNWRNEIDGENESEDDDENSNTQNDYEDPFFGVLTTELEDEGENNSLTFRNKEIELSSKLLLNPIGVDLPNINSFSIPIEEQLTYSLPHHLMPFEYDLKILPVLPPLKSKSRIDEILSNIYNNTYNESDSDNINSTINTATTPGEITTADDLTLFTAIGEVIISFECIESTDRIVMHEFNISIDEASVKVSTFSNEADGLETLMDIPVVGHEYDKMQQFYTVRLGENLQAGRKYQVRIKFISYVTTQGSSLGIFATTYTDPVTDQTKYMAATKFQATHARKAFPCFDQPHMKSVFHITIGRRALYSSLSNAELKETFEDPDREGWFWDKFHPTPRMSTYLVCFTVSDFTSEEADKNLTNGKSIKVWAPNHLIAKEGGVYAADLTAKIVAYFEDYFNLTDLQKVDSIVVPLFTTSAMENWGLITYMEHMLIYIPKENSQYRRSLVTTVVAHELSHHYFGNLVTCKTWDFLWLNEGFATYLSFMVMEHFHPEFDPEAEFVNDIIQLSMRTDPNPSTQPVRVFAKSPTEIDSAFSRTTYRKGGSIIRMMEYFLGKEALQEGMRRFLHHNAYESATQDDLFEELDHASRHLLPHDVSVKKIMDTWTLQSGFPIVRVEIAGPHSIKLSQEKINWSPLERNINPDVFWWIPVTIITAEKPKHSTTFPNIWMPANTSHLFFTGDFLDINKWIVVNPNYSGYFSVLYDEHLTRLIKNQLDTDHTVFSPVTRSQILFDYINFWTARYVSFEAALNMTTYIGNDREFVVWNALFPFFSDLNRRLLATKEHHKLFLKYLVPKLEKVWLSIGLEVKPNEKPTALFFRTEIMTQACQLDSQICLDYAKDLFIKWKGNSTVNPFPELQEEMLACAMVKAVGEEAWEFIFAKYQKLTTQYQKWVLFKALTCSTSEDLIYRTLDVIQNSTLHTWQSLPTQGIVNLASNKHAIKLLFNHVLNNYNTNSTFFLPDMVASAMTSLSYYLYEQEDILALKNFIQQHKFSLFKELKSLIHAINVMEENRDWVSVHGAVLYNWLLSNV